MIRATKKILKILDSRQKKIIVLIAIMMLIGGVMESLSVTLMLPLITAVMDTTNWNSKWYAVIICDIFHIETQKMYVISLLILIIGIFIIKNIYLLLEYYIQFSFVSKSRVKLQRKLMHCYVHKPYTFYLNSSTGEIVRIVTGDTNQTFGLLTSLLTFYTEMIVSVVLGVTVLIMSPKIGIGLVIILCVEVLLIAKIVKPILKRCGDRFRKENSLVNKWLLQALNGIKSIKVSNRESFFEEKYSSHANVAVDVDRKQQTLGVLPRLMIEAFTITAVLVMLLLMILFGTNLVDIIPQLSAFVVAFVRLLPSINRISAAVNQIPFLEGALDNVTRTLQTEKKYFDSETDMNDRVSSASNIAFQNSIVFDHITFYYPETENPVLEDASFSIKPGQSVGIVGTSGAGKTTVVDILLGLLQPQSGCVLVDGTDIGDNVVAWRNLLAYIPQSIFLMDDTIRENVAFGAHREEIDDEKVWRALKSAQLESLVKEMPEGLDTVVGEAGIRLSGGQRQRLGIARALYNDPDILFFDEATSALDVDTENAIMESIDNLKGQKTLVIIAHRLTTIENCDVIYRVEQGKIVRER